MDIPHRLLPFLINALAPYRYWILYSLLLGLVEALQTSLSPYALKRIIDTVVSHTGALSEVGQVVLWPVCIYIGLEFSRACVFRLTDHFQLRVYPVLSRDIILYMNQALNTQSYQFFQDQFTGGTLNRISEIARGAISIYQRTFDAFGQLLRIIIATITLWLVHPIFARIMLGWIGFFVLVAIYCSNHISKLSTTLACSRSEYMGLLADAIANSINWRLFARSKYEQQLVATATQTTVQCDRNMQWAILRMRIVWDSSIVVLVGGMICGLILNYQAGELSIGDFSLVTALTVAIYYPVWWLASQLVDFYEEIGKCKQALDTLTVQPDLQDLPNAKPLQVGQAKIELANVSFQYLKDKPLIEQLSLTIEPGMKVGLVGFTGCGKSTIVNLILRLYDPQQGALFIDGQDISCVTRTSLRQAIGMIPQDTSLFHRSLMENIRYGKLDATDAEVMAAARAAHCEVFISELPDAYQTLVGERGVKLSGGQRQRIAIARAILKDAPILILDEATSALDSVTEKLIQDALEGLMCDRTTLVIAHRLSTLCEMDKIIVLEHGKIVESGDHQTLLGKQGRYALMWRMQVGGFLPSAFAEDLADK